MSIKLFALVITLLLTFNRAFAAAAPANVYPTDATHSNYPLPTQTYETLCPAATIAGVNLNKNPQTVQFSNEDCGTYFGTYGGGGAFVGGYIGLGFTPNCPSDHPYMGGFNEIWSGTMYGVGGIGFSTICCTTPQAAAKLQMTWMQNLPNGTCP